MKRADAQPEEPACPDEGRDTSQDTKKISREELESVLKRTRSGTRRAVRSDPVLAPLVEPAPPEPTLDAAPSAGPFADCSPSSIERVARIEFEIDSASLSEPPSPPAGVPDEPARATSSAALAPPARSFTSVLRVALARVAAAVRSVSRWITGG